MPRGIPNKKKDVMEPVEKNNDEAHAMSSYGKKDKATTGMGYTPEKLKVETVKLPPYPRSELIGR